MHKNSGESRLFLSSIVPSDFFSSVDVWNAVPKCRALFPFSAQMKCDLQFETGAVISTCSFLAPQRNPKAGRKEICIDLAQTRKGLLRVALGASPTFQQTYLSLFRR